MLENGGGLGEDMPSGLGQRDGPPDPIEQRHA